jgi:alkanesulfonate monooxygenase SsuD/methylene tetrahydromethanopterin reductase-like flavin-dependent oxidoreductase (luciferase family)
MIHQAHFFRHPAIAAKMMATLDQLSGGRFILFADTGTRAAEHHAYGLRYPAAMEDRMPDFLEGLELILKLWQTRAGAPLTHAGRFYQVTGAVCAPGPFTQPHPPIWFGEAHPLTLQACAQWGQGWNSAPVGLAELDRRLAALREACARSGRAFEKLEISYETQVLVAPHREAVRERLRSMLRLTPAGATTPDEADFLAFVNGDSDAYPRYLTDAWLVGDPDEVKAQVSAYVALGVGHFLLWFMDAPEMDGMRLFMEAVAPTVRGSS